MIEKQDRLTLERRWGLRVETPTKKNSQNVEMSKQEAVRRVLKAMEVCAWGDIIIKMQNGKPVFVDVVYRERVG